MGCDCEGHEEEFHAQLLKFLSGRASRHKDRHNRHAQGEIAKKLVEEDPALLLPANKSKLGDAIEATYNRDCAATFTLNPRF